MEAVLLDRSIRLALNMLTGKSEQEISESFGIFRHQCLVAGYLIVADQNQVRAKSHPVLD